MAKDTADKQTLELDLRTPFNYNRDAESIRTGLTCKDPSLARQEFKDEADINILFGKYMETGEIPQLQDFPTYGDFTGVFDYQSAMNLVVAGREAFQTLPAKHRAKFDNNPGKFMNWLEDPENKAEAQKLGYVKPDEPNQPKEETPPSKPIVNP